MDLDQVRRYLAGLEKRGIHLDLDPVSRLLATLGDPHLTYRTVHVGGTNGKGSVAAMIASILGAAGYRVGLYTSPHLVDFRERIRINGVMIPEDALVRLVSELRHYITEDITYFEFATVLASRFFQEQSVNIAVFEVGMGGRLDATNCIMPEVSVITTISLEHERYLGRRLVDIAAEKAEIIKKDGVCVTGVTQRKVLAVIEKTAQILGARVLRRGKDFTARRRGKTTFSYYGINHTLRNLRLPLPGDYQVSNAALAAATAEILAEKGMEIDDRALIEGIESTAWEGRLETVGVAPLIVLDGAHNPEGVRALCRTLPRDFSYERLIVLFGVMEDKHCRSMLSRISLLADRIIVTEPPGERTRRLSRRDLDDFGLDADRFEIIPCVQDAFQRACSLAGPEDMVLVTGSLYLLGEIKRQGV